MGKLKNCKAIWTDNLCDGILELRVSEDSVILTCLHNLELTRWGQKSVPQEGNFWIKGKRSGFSENGPIGESDDSTHTRCVGIWVEIMSSSTNECLLSITGAFKEQLLLLLAI